jgi:primosomal protein N' (replication factor Y)
VILPLPLPHAFSYDASAQETCPEPGTIVQVPFGKQALWGVVWPSNPASSPAPTSTLKPIHQVYEGEKLPPTLISFIDWVARYTMTPVGKILKMALHTKALLRDKKPKRQKKLASLPDSEQSRREAQRQSVTLSPDQDAAAEALKASIDAQKFDVILLDGVTGSGKTEVYFEALERALDQGLQSLILLPEIALTTQWIQRFQDRFGFSPTQWHSDLTPARKEEAWRSILQGEARVVVGARSALFLPFPRLGMVVVDEEHDPSFKQEEGVIYHGRDMAIVRARIHGIPIILASATPSLETFHNAQQDRYKLLKLSNRHAGASLPLIQLIDLRQEAINTVRLQGGKKSLISSPLHQAIEETLEKKQQVLLFLNRRGFAPLTLCKKCGHRIPCPYCSVPLVDHRHRLLCHQCGHKSPKPTACPQCHEEDCLISWGPGVERLADEVAYLYPHARTALMSSDTLSGSASIRQLIQQIQDREIDLLIGTQMIAKGYHFPSLTLVGVIDGDLGLSGGDPRASERTFHLLSQVAGRSGRAQEKGHVLLQSHMPDHPVMQALVAGNRDLFLSLESQERQAYGLPPYGRLAALILSGKNAWEVEGAGRQLAQLLPPLEEREVWGPAPAPLHVIRGRHRWRFLIKSTQSSQGFIHQWLSGWSCPKGVQVQIDMDPYNFL